MMNGQVKRTDKRLLQNWIDTNRAIEILVDSGIHCTRTSLLTWAEKYQLGKKVGGRWYIEKDRLQDFMKGKVDGN